MRDLMKNWWVSVRFSLVAAGLLLAVPAAGTVLDERPQIQDGLWLLALLEADGCEECASVLPWVQSAAVAFPEFNFVLSYGTGLPDEGHLPSGAIALYDDPSGQFRRELGVESVPSILVMVAGKLAGVLVWPFLEGDVLRAVALASVLADNLPTTALLVGLEAPLFVGQDADGKDVGLWDAGYPLLLVFVSPGCSSCWATLESVGKTPSEVHVLLVVVGDSRGLSGEEEALVASITDRSETVSWLLLQNQRVVQAYMLAKVPTYIAIDGEGRVAAVHEGWASEEELESLVAQLTSDNDH